MILSVLQKLKKHYLFAVYLVVASGILIGLIEGFKIKYSYWVIFYYLLPLLGFYGLIQYTLHKKKLNSRFENTFRYFSLSNKLTSQQILLGFVSIILVTLIVHIIILKGLPGFEAVLEFNQRKLVHIRRGVTAKLPVWFKYIYSFVLKGIIPMGLLLAYHFKNKRIFILLSLIALIYGINGMQKGHFLTFYGPTFILLLLNKSYKNAAVLGSYIFGCLVLLVFIANPGLKYTILKHFMDVKLPKEVSQEVLLDDGGEGGEGIVKANKKAVNSLYLRTFYLPGATVGRWFEAVPKKRPFLYGKGYKWYAKISGEKYHDYGSELYGVIYPSYVRRGFVGRVNVASFMYDYVNFKQYGLVYSALGMALLLSFISMLFNGDFKMMVVLNTIPVLYLSSTNYTTLLFSGGWLLIICIYLVFLKKYKAPNEH